MPNWVDTTLTITGPLIDIEVCLSKATTVQYDRFASSPMRKTEFNYFDFEALHPTPKKCYEGNDEGKVFPDWYAWRVNHWGTKWSAAHSQEPQWEIIGNTTGTVDEKREVEARVTLRFDTAWSPCTALLEKVSKDFPTLTFEIDVEDEMGNFYGTARVKFGEETEEELIDGPHPDRMAEDAALLEEEETDECSATS